MAAALQNGGGQKKDRERLHAGIISRISVDGV